jgi:hypothetical protein
MIAANGKNAMWESKRFQVRIFLIYWLVVVAVLPWGFCGCSVVQSFQPETPSYDRLSAVYDNTQLGTTRSLDVLEMVRVPQHEATDSAEAHLVSQSDTVVAALGRSEQGYETWFTIVTFDEHTMAARRKYFYLVDERVAVPPPRAIQFLTEPKRGLMFDCQTALENEVLSQPYATEEAKQIAILRHLEENFRQDLQELSQGRDSPGRSDEVLSVSGMLMSQVFDAVMLELSRSPVLAGALKTRNGLEFDHISFDKGRIRLVVEGDVATVKVRLGLFRYGFEADRDASRMQAESAEQDSA